MVWRFLFGHEFLVRPKEKIMNSDNAPNQPKHPHKTKSMILPEENHSMLTNPSPEQWQDEKRTLIGLFKMRPGETIDDFAQRIIEAYQQSPHNPANKAKKSEKPPQQKPE
jgi:hypothetical protein